ncbi:M23 family metallopeptidase [Leifsonia sp. McL0607]|uniref:M23 family metallopeptidase n=1 Tax=Leifsonia sp. McL0607 TaxID=3415672 RepID=UPI003CF1DA40
MAAASVFALAIATLASAPAQAAPEYIYPTVSRTVSDSFAAHVSRQPPSSNPGTDYVVPVGTSVQAVRAGTVTMSAWWGDGGNTVRIDHGGGIVTEYLHNSALLVSAGQRVQQGETIALSGNTGSSTGPHLHIVLRINGTNVDFEKYVGDTTASPAGGTLTYAAVLATGGTAIAKGELNSAWTTLTGSVDQIAVAAMAGGPVIAVRTTNGTVLTKSGYNGAWTTQVTGARSVALTGDETTGVSLAVILESGTLIAKTGLGAPWVTLTSGVTDVSIASDPVYGLTIAAVSETGMMSVKQGLSGYWQALVNPAAAVEVASDPLRGPTFVVLSPEGTVWSKTGISAPWVTLTSGATSIAVASDASVGPSIGVVLSSGTAIVKSGGLYAPWVTIVNDARELAIDSDAGRGFTVMYLSTGGTVAVKSGLGGTWTTITGGATAIALP